MERPEWDDHVDRDAPLYPAAPIPLHERTWRHPSELAATSHFVPPPAEELHRGVLIAASLLGLACVIGLALVLLPGDPPTDPTVLGAPAVSDVAMTSLARSTRANTPWIGADGTDGTDGTDGVLIARVQSDSPAAASGLQEGDLVVAIDGAPVGDLQSFRRVIQRAGVGDWLAMTVMREGTSHSMSVEVRTAP